MLLIKYKLIFPLQNNKIFLKIFPESKIKKSILFNKEKYKYLKKINLLLSNFKTQNQILKRIN